MQVVLGSPEKIEPILEEPGSTVVHLTSSEKHLLYTDSRGQVTATSIDTLKAVAITAYSAILLVDIFERRKVKSLPVLYY